MFGCSHNLRVLVRKPFDFRVKIFVGFEEGLSVRGHVARAEDLEVFVFNVISVLHASRLQKCDIPFNRVQDTVVVVVYAKSSRKFFQQPANVDKDDGLPHRQRIFDIDGGAEVVYERRFFEASKGII